MTQTPKFTPTEQKAIEQLLLGRSNKQIALALGIAERTVEFHLHSIYEKLGVSSKVEAIVELNRIQARGGHEVPPDETSQLGESTGQVPAESTVGKAEGAEYKDSEEQAMPKRKKRKSFTWIIWIIVVLLLIGIATSAALLMLSSNTAPWRYEREAEFPDEFSVGQDLDRSEASGAKVHGQFGTQSFEPWSPQTGFAKYYNIEIPKNGSLYLQLRYSKFSKSSVPILVYLDDEQNPRASIYPTDQGDWNKFTETGWIPLGEIRKGIHALRFFTNGQQYGVADLDKFTLTTEPP